MEFHIRRADAIDWAMRQGVFNHIRHCRGTFDLMLQKQFADVDPVANQEAIFSAWGDKVREKIEERKKFGVKRGVIA